MWFIDYEKPLLQYVLNHTFLKNSKLLYFIDNALLCGNPWLAAANQFHPEVQSSIHSKLLYSQVYHVNNSML